MSSAAGFLDFFVLEASDYIEQLDGLLAHAGAMSPDADSLQRLARALRGSATMAKLPAFAELAGAVERIGRAWPQLMARLGYERYGAQGGDWGAMVTTSIGQQDRDHVAGIHVQLAIVRLEPNLLTDLTEREQSSLDSGAYYSRWGSGYSTQQASRPQTLGYGLVDSPAAQCAWIVEKFWDWTDCDGHPENVLSRDDLLDNVMLYWMPATGASSARLYWESFHSTNTDPVDVPSGVSVFPKEIFRPSRRWVETRFTDLRYYNELEQGGHFAAFEQPDAFVDEVRAFFRLVRAEAA